MASWILAVVLVFVVWVHITTNNTSWVDDGDDYSAMSTLRHYSSSMVPRNGVGCFWRHSL
jgi:hypothetical protein